VEKKLANAVAKKLRVSPRKLTLVANLIKGMKVNEALITLTFCRKAIALQVKKCLQSAVANAENNFGYDIDNLIVSKSVVGKSFVMKRHIARAKGRAGKINKFFSNLYITVEEIEGI
jgi:large subunit ribosomal protein L22